MTSAIASDACADVIVVGAGAAGMTAAAVAAAQGLRVLLLEQSRWIGGTTAISGGMVWIPANHKMPSAGIADSLDEARRYLGHTIPPGGDAQALETFLTRGDEAIRYLEARTALRLQPVMRYPDYYPERPGATPAAGCSSRYRSMPRCSAAHSRCCARRCRSSCCSAA